MPRHELLTHVALYTVCTPAIALGARLCFAAPRDVAYLAGFASTFGLGLLIAAGFRWASEDLREQVVEAHVLLCLACTGLAVLIAGLAWLAR